jgi:glycosyltransferase involved in cell wall biosynthesis
MLLSLLFFALLVRSGGACPWGPGPVGITGEVGELTGVKAPAEVCLNMIVKNEAHVINRALDSAGIYFRRWIIVDTGSTDDTLQILRQRRQPNRDVIATAEWKDFGTNREHALQVARDAGCKFVFFLDADDTVEFDPDFEWPPYDQLAAASWATVEVLYGTLRYERKALVNTAANCHWHDVLHEYVACVTPTGQLDPNAITLKGIRIRVRSGGARSRDPDKYLKDAALLEAELAKNPEHSRYAFYLAQSYRDAGRPEQALKAYERRAMMRTGFGQETYEALLEIALLRVKLRQGRDEIDAAFQAAYEFDKERWETIYYWADYYRTTHINYVLCYALIRIDYVHSLRPLPQGLFVRSWIYHYGVYDLTSVCSYYAGHIDKSHYAAEKALAYAIKHQADAATLERLRANVALIAKHIDKQ